MKFSESHEWILLEGDIATIGVSQYAQKELGNIVYVELPQVGKFINAQEEVVVLESTKAAVDIYSPLSGEIVEVNDSLKEFPEKINNEAQKGGWLYRVRIAKKEEYEKLRDVPYLVQNSSL